MAGRTRKVWSKCVSYVFFHLMALSQYMGSWTPFTDHLLFGSRPKPPTKCHVNLLCLRDMPTTDKQDWIQQHWQKQHTQPSVGLQQREAPLLVVKGWPHYWSTFIWHDFAFEQLIWWLRPCLAAIYPVKHMIEIFKSSTRFCSSILRNRTQSFTC